MVVRRTDGAKLSGNHANIALMAEKKSIDDLVTARRRKKSELAELGAEITASARPIAVCFVDLADSTALKHDRDPEEWLGYVFDFVQMVDHVAVAAGGTVVKRIGDELMITFGGVADAESFIDSAATNELLGQFKFKIAVDFGDAYHFRFIENLADDPYGPVVDRCARIAKLVSAGAVLTTREYIQRLENPSDYVSLGQFSLKGIPEVQELYVRSLLDVDSEQYLAPLTALLNDTAPALSGYRFTGRIFTSAQFREFGSAEARPFLVRELLNVPRLPLTLPELDRVLRNEGSSSQKHLEFYGYMVEWVAALDDVGRDKTSITVTLKDTEATIYSRIKLRLPLSYWELVKPLKKDQRIRIRGIISRIFLSIELNYVDFDVLSSGA